MGGWDGQIEPFLGIQVEPDGQTTSSRPRCRANKTPAQLLPFKRPHKTLLTSAFCKQPPFCEVIKVRLQKYFRVQVLFPHYTQSNSSFCPLKASEEASKRPKV